MTPMTPPLVVLTRPRRESRLTARALGARAIECIRMPLQSTRRAPHSAALDADLNWASTASVQIFVSRAAVAAAIALASPQVVAARVRIAVGRATAAMLQRHGLAAVVAPGHAEDSDGVLGLAPLLDVHRKRVAIWAAPGGRERIADVLRERGAEVRVIAVYRRLPCRPRAASLQQLRRAANRLVFSATSAALLDALDHALVRQRMTFLRTRPLIVASARIAERARALGFECVQVAAGASAQALIAALDDPLWRA
jgi:uroporphyrinogen-III synthase